MLTLTTSGRLALLVFVFLLWTPAAYAWSRPVQGSVLQPFAYDEAHPYAAGQHRGVDLEADAAGETVVAPAGGTVSFAGTVPTNGKSVTIETADGYSVTLTHLGSIAVVKGATVAEQDAIGAVGPSGTPEVDVPYVHLGIRVTADPNGYVDPLRLLPPAPESGADQSGSTAAQPSSTGAASAPPTTRKPARSVPAKLHVAADHAASTQGVSSHEHERAQESRTEVEPRHIPHRPKARETRMPLEVATPRSRPSVRTGSIRRPFVEPMALGSPTAAPSARPRPAATVSVVGLVCNGVAALCALGAALAASRRRRRGQAIPAAGVQVLRLAAPETEPRCVSRAA
ncbi:MAG TPA: M23 family metallopeptidase [Gaiellaceae bacterium]|nr:M23 family metallopeptidase [Gaiellaceae bacterium]